MYGLYLHVPFCRRKCLYCDFVSQPSLELLPAYVGAVLLHLRRHAGKPLSTVFAGGGTPTLLPPESIRETFSAIRGLFDCRSLGEVTVEANPESLAEGALAALRSSGVNRLSIGAQSLCDRELAALGRVHTAEEFLSAFRRARASGFGNINIDLIYGLPSQTLEQWKKNLERAVALGSEHLSLYPLSIEPDTPFHDRGVAVSGDDQAEMYEWSAAFLSSAGYEHYEISNWARPGFACRHNLTYWQNREYIGVGPAAASYLDGRRSKNVPDVAEYIRRVKAGEDPADEKEEIDEAKRLSEEIILKLRCSEGIGLERIRSRYPAAVKELLQKELLEPCGQNVRLTRKGMLLANQVFQEFV
ncbi:MAG: radical SAM family heme chaperone HemW [Endomicrobiales bacterium]